MRKTEVAGIVKLLESDEWESAEDCAKAIINWLDEDRADRTGYIGVMQFGTQVGKLFYVGLGPYPGRKSALAALLKHPAVDEAAGKAVVPVTSPEGILRMLKDLDTYKRPA